MRTHSLLERDTWKTIYLKNGPT